MRKKERRISVFYIHIPGKINLVELRNQKKVNPLIKSVYNINGYLDANTPNREQYNIYKIQIPISPSILVDTEEDFHSLFNETEDGIITLTDKGKEYKSKNYSNFILQSEHDKHETLLLSKIVANARIKLLKFNKINPINNETELEGISTENHPKSKSKKNKGIRTNLKKHINRRIIIKGKVERFGIKYGWLGNNDVTILLVDVFDITDNFLTDHIWFIAGVWSSNVKIGDIIQFEARVTKYISGYQGNDPILQVEKPIKTNYRLSNPTKLKILKSAEDIKQTDLK